MLAMMLSRVVFYVFNSSNFLHLGLSDLAASFWFDAVTISLLGFPYLALSILPLPFQANKWYLGLKKILFYLTFIILIALNLIDVEYFSYSQKRSTADLFTILSAGNDFAQQITSFFRDFWMLLVFLILFYVGMVFLLNKIKIKAEKFSFKRDVFWFLVCLTSFIVIGRGGFQLKPISPIDASKFTRIENAALVLNTPFTMVKSFNKGGLDEKNYFSEQEEMRLFNPIQSTHPQHLYDSKPNIVIIILESFGNEWIGAAGAKKSFTPFLDSLTKVSLYFKNGVSNGKKSIEAVPSIVSSLPSLMDNPYISSSYGSNKVTSLASLLKNYGYESGFFHGATNGSMRFDGFAAQTGFDHYMGRKEYKNDEHFDKSWGILDEYFNPWTAKELSNYHKPFFATLFTLSSHHPYYIPPHMRGKLRKGPQPICESIHYGDYSLAKFFKEAKKQAWYNNTIFVICADHTSATESEIYNQRTELFKIPILFFDPSGKLKAKKEERLFQHIDIMPTLLDLLDLELSYYAFGNSYFKNTDPEAITFLEGTYHYFRNNHLLTFSSEKARNLYSIKVQKKDTPDSLSYYKKESKLYEKRLKAIIQRYNRDLILNQTHIK